MKGVFVIETLRLMLILLFSLSDNKFYNVSYCNLDYTKKHELVNPNFDTLLESNQNQ